MKVAGKCSALGDGCNQAERCLHESNIPLTKLKSVSTTSVRDYGTIMGMVLTLLNGHNTPGLYIRKGTVKELGFI